MKTILVPLDGSTCAEQVLPYALGLAQLLDARIRLLRVIPEETVEPVLVETVAVLNGSDDPVTAERHRRHAQQILHHERAVAYLALQAGRLKASRASIDLDVQVGKPAAAIIEAATQSDVAMIAMGTHGYSGIRRLALGSVADAVVHATPTPVLLVRCSFQPPQSAVKLAHILVPLDGSASSAVALPLATALAQRADASVTLVRAVAPTLGIYPELRAEGTHASYHQVLTALRDQAITDLTLTHAHLQQQGVRAAHVVATGHPAEVIVDEAQRRAAGLIVMATHGYTGTRRWALGSTADKVLHTSTVPILLVHVSMDA